MRRSVEGRGMGRDTRGKQDGHYRDFQEGEVGLGWINGGRKDQDFGWEKIRDSGELPF